jgi:membrane protein DedA with SNARE-associated domain/rhodanese-related sulfurtransferase
MLRRGSPVMSPLVSLVTQHGAATVFVAVLLKQLGLPVPTVPLLLATGALAGNGLASPVTVVALACVASLLGHSAWFLAGRRAGRKVLRLVCRVSLQPDACVRRGLNFLGERGGRAVFFSYFLPGVDTVVQPLAAIAGMSWRRFIGLNLLGAVTWAGSYVGLGYALGPRLEQALGVVERLGAPIGRTAAAMFLLYLGWKLLYRQLAIRRLQMARVSPQELRQKLDDGSVVFVVDLRHRLEVTNDPQTIPGAVTIPIEELDAHFEEIPRDREVITFCSCPNEHSAALAAYRLHRRGITLVRPLAGGLDEWRRLDYATGLVTSGGSPSLLAAKKY